MRDDDDPGIPGRPARIDTRRKVVFAVLGFVLSTLLATVFAEGVLRVAGYQTRPRPTGRKAWAMEPRQGFIRYSDRRGYAYGPGEFTVTFASGYQFQMSHGADGLRRTAPADRVDKPPSTPEVWIFGGSFTHGWSVNDDQTFPWKLQRLMPEFRVVNFGVGGYGTLLSWIQFEEALEQRPAPELIVLAYGSFHDERNTWTRNWLQTIAPARKENGRPIPRAVYVSKGSFDVVREVPGYRPFPLVHVSALSNLLEDGYGRVNNRLSRRSRQVTESILLAFQQRCEETGIQLVVAAILDNGATRKRLAFCNDAGITTCDISVDLDQNGLRNLPHDEHPGPLAHAEYARTLAARLHEVLSAP